MAVKPDILKTDIVSRSKLFNIEEVHLRFSNGEERCFERFLGRSKHSVLMVPMLDDKTLLLVREYGVGIEDYYLSFPAGGLENEEEYAVGADRELKEEVGYGAKDWQLLKSIRSSPAYSTSVMHILLARDLYPEQAEGDEPEPLEVVAWPIAEASALMAREDFSDSKSIAALYLLQDYLRATA